MSNANLEERAKGYAELLRADPALVRSMFRLIRLVLEEGTPVSVEKVASGLGVSRYEANATLNGLRFIGAEFDEEDSFVGFGLTLIPTRHRYKVNGRNFYMWCADDAIFFPAMLGHAAVIESPDPINGENVRLAITPEGVEHVEPETAVVSRRSGGGAFENVRGTVCHYGHFFVSPETASEYSALHAGLGLEVTTVEEAFRIGQILLEQEPLKSMLAG